LTSGVPIALTLNDPRCDGILKDDAVHGRHFIYSIAPRCGR
jgi:hypothetical protein